MKRCLFLGVSFIILSLCHLYAQQLPKGEGKFTFTDYAPFSGRPVDVYYYIPPTGDLETMPVIFVFQGADRGFNYLMEFWKKVAEERQFIFVLPHFDLQLYPLEDYQETGVLTADRKHARPQRLQTSALVDEIFNYLQKHTGTKATKYMMYGHSAGGQFIHRFMLFYDSPYVEKAIVGSPGWYTFPDKEQSFPYGVASIPYVDRETLKRYLSKDMVIQLGKADTVRESYLRKTPEADAQGSNRLERGRAFYAYARQLATDNNWSFHWRKEEVEGVGHNSVRMAENAIPTLLNDSIRVLFIGNSYTFYNEMPRMVQALACSNGKPLSVKMVEHGGWTLQLHANNKETLDAIKEGGWDYVILQEQSQAPAREREWVLKNIYPYAQALDSVRRMFNPHGKTVFYMTWGHYTDAYQEMQQRLAETYLDLSKRLNAWCAPVGMAWKRVLDEKLLTRLHDPDNSHPNLQGSYLAANVFYSTLFQEPYQSAYTAGLPADEAGYLQRTAQELVLSNLFLWNLRPIPQPEAVTTRFYPIPEKEYHTPTLGKPVTEGLASLTEISRYLGVLAKEHPTHVSLSTLGVSTGGQEIPILYFGSGKDKNKIRVWIQAGLHGNEPAGSEAVCMLADYLLNDTEGKKLLTYFELALVPVANVDGYAIQNRISGYGLDLNRDQSKLADPVSVLLKKAYMDWSPEVALDIHEFIPWRKDYNAFFHKPVAIYEDVLFLPTGHLNVPEPIRDFSLNVLQKSTEEALMEKGYTWGHYFTPKVEGNRLRIAKGAKSPQSSSTNFALSNAVSLFVEIRGIGLGRSSFERRTEVGFIIAVRMLETCCKYKDKLKSTIRKAIADTKKGRKPAYVSFKGKESPYTAQFVDFAQNDTFSVTLPASDVLYCEPVITRPRPKAYILTDTCRNAVRILEILGADIKRTSKSFTRNVEEYTVTAYEKSATIWEMIYPVEVKTETKKIRKTFPAGSYIVSPNQKAGNYIVTLLEPESINGFIPFGVIEAQPGMALPVYRQIVR